ncbi:MAG: ABC transporter ATP-binding protein [Nitrospira sp.]|nr:ABC transporter ATP-binding protein [Nitrospira sp.]
MADVTALEARDVNFSYGTRLVLDAVSFSVPRGRVLSLLGPNGCGKSTVIKIMLGLLRPHGGAVWLDGCDVSRLSIRDRARRMAYVPQAHTLSFPYRVSEVVLMGRFAHRRVFQQTYSAQEYRVVRDAMERVGIAHLAGRIYTEISGGERQLALIARALAQGAEILVMDEPVSGLDFGNQWRLLREVRALAAEGLTVLKSTHFPDHAFLSSDEVILMHEGKILAQGRPEEAMTKDRLHLLYGVEVNILTQESGIRCCVPAGLGNRPKGSVR